MSQVHQFLLIFVSKLTGTNYVVRIQFLYYASNNGIGHGPYVKFGLDNLATQLNRTFIHDSLAFRTGVAVWVVKYTTEVVIFEWQNCPGQLIILLAIFTLNGYN